MARPAKPWFWKARQAWYVTIDGKRIKLDTEKEEAFRRFYAIKAEKTVVDGPSDLLVVIIDKYLDWTHKNRSDGSYRFYLEHCNHFHAWLKANRLTSRSPRSQALPG